VSSGREPPGEGELRSGPGPHPAPQPAAPPDGLCPSCAHVRIVRSQRGSTFLLCELSRSDARFPRYPPQPRILCAGFRR
jgi:hypothetical protein